MMYFIALFGFLAVFNWLLRVSKNHEKARDEVKEKVHQMELTAARAGPKAEAALKEKLEAVEHSMREFISM